MKNWRTNKAYTDSTKIKSNMVRKEAMRVYGPSEQVGKPVYRLKDITRIKYDNREVAVVDEFIDAYMGKVYKGYDFKRFGINEALEPSEVLTMTVERFADVKNMQRLYQEHPDLFQIIVGMSRAKGL